MDQLPDIFTRKEDLHPELQPYVADISGFKALRHPLVYSVPHHPAMNAMMNEQFRHKSEYLKKAIAERVYGRIVSIHERPYRLEALIIYCYDAPDEEWWELVGFVWSDSENIWQNRENWSRIFRMRKASRHKMMDEEELARLESLPDVIEVYRGCRKHNERGWSWTLDKDIALMFARRLSQSKTGLVLHGKVSKEKVIAVMLGRKEEEVIVSWTDVEITQKQVIR